MRTLYHWPLDPASRQARIALGETKLKFTLEAVNPWEPDDRFLSRVPEGMPPALIEQTQSSTMAITGARAICEYAHDGTKRHKLLPDDPLERAEARRLCDWFDAKFADEVQSYILHEKVEKAMDRRQQPDVATLRQGREHLAWHLGYLKDLLSRRDWLAGHRFSLADIAATAHLSCLDFLGEIRWRDHVEVKAWYATVKSRPSVQPLLADRVAGLYPPAYYKDLDF